MKYIFFKTVLASSLFFALNSNAVTFEKREISLAHTAATSHAHHKAALLFAEEVKKATNGQVTVHIYGASELGDQPALLEQCVNGGDVDIVLVSQSNIAVYVKEVTALSAPFLFDNYDIAHKVIDSYVMPWLSEKLPNDANLVPLSMFDYGFRHVTTKDIEVKKAEDLKGVKIRVPGSVGLLATFDALGSNTQTIAYSELYQSLKQGVVDAEENPVATILADSYFECQNQLALTGHFYDMQALIINKDIYDDMSTELQEVIKDAAKKAQDLTRTLIPGDEENVIAKLKEKGMNVTTVDKQSFINKMDSAYKKISSISGEESLNNLLDAVKKTK